MMMLIVDVFADPMMGLAYEAEPVLRYLESHYAGKIAIRYRMAVLVKDVYDWMTPFERSFPAEQAFKLYNRRLAQIYLAEEAISGMPMNMDNLNLFSVAETTSLPLSLAYKTVEYLVPQQAEAFLYRLRLATIAEGRQTTKLSVLLELAETFGLSKANFIHYYQSDSVSAALNKDFSELEMLHIGGLPVYRLSYEGRWTAVSGVITAANFDRLISQLTEQQIKPQQPDRDLKHLKQLLDQHPIISLNELKTVYDFQSEKEIKEFIAPLSENLVLDKVKNSWFIHYRR
ncbi:DsbA family protein [Streptococcus chenjunshii]|uniref:DsbA family protein n=1 Tax=Streptococcus chenjunshii TaxID=2173853 RepID=A0A372KK62_9STRE|nr:DsbA family protein [Streptococcus chenjunshii]AXQ77883.1 DsbA family protein [Streptococcus chenjunshii]RFU50207.1 DsbA family protein [Streptococcus chenjunshii]RFU52386.1 DsbA family protein [Streptococcus chenjunshii]